MKEKLAVVSFPTLLAFCAGAPDDVRSSGFVLLVMFVLDSITGIFSAILGKEVSSGKMRRKLYAKALEYFIIITLGMCVTILSQEYIVLHLAFLSLIACEAVSFLENLVKIEKRSGVRLPGPISPFLKFIGSYFHIEDLEGATVYHHVAVVPPSGDPDGVISHTEIQRTNIKSPTKEAREITSIPKTPPSPEDISKV